MHPMKVILVIVDGLADRPQPALDGRTPLECAVTPTLDRLASTGRVGRVLPTPSRPGAALSNLLAIAGAEGFAEPSESQSSRSPAVSDPKHPKPANNIHPARTAHGWFAALARGLVSGSDRRLAAMLSFMAESDGEIADPWLDDLRPEEVSLILSRVLKPIQEWTGWELHPNDRGEVIAVAPPGLEAPVMLPPAPRALVGRRWRELLAKGHQVERLILAANRSLAASTASAVRVDLGMNPVNLAWLWGMAALPKGVPPGDIRVGGNSARRDQVRLTICTASDVAAGVALWLGHGVVRAGSHEPPPMQEPENVPGLSALGVRGSSSRRVAASPTDVPEPDQVHAAAFAALADRAVAWAADDEVTLVHTSVVDATSARRRPLAKRKLIELLDRNLLAPLKDGLDAAGGQYRLCVLAGSVNDSGTGRHTDEPMPFMLSGSGLSGQSTGTLTESNAARSALTAGDAAGLLPWLVSGL